MHADNKALTCGRFFMIYFSLQQKEPILCVN